MADTLEERWPRGLFTALLFCGVLLLMLATLAPTTLVDRVMLKERAWAVALFSPADMDQLLARTDRLYTALVIDSGAKPRVVALFMPRGGTVAAFEQKVDGWFDYLRARGEVVQKILYQMLYRIALMLYWLPLFAAVLVPALYAGWMRWHAKRHGFDYASPFLSNSAASILGWGCLLMLLSILSPLPLPPLLLSTFISIAVPLLLSVFIANLPKRL